MVIAVPAMVEQATAALPLPPHKRSKAKVMGPTIKRVMRPNRMPEIPPVIKLDRLMDAPS